MDDLRLVPEDIDKKFTILFPSGSTNSDQDGRFNISRYLNAAGLEIRGFDPDKETLFPVILNQPDAFPIAARPQHMASFLSEGLADACCCFDDVVIEATLGGIKGVRKVMPLLFGEARVVAAVSQDSRFKSISELLLRRTHIRVLTEYPFLTARTLVQTAAYRDRFGSVKPRVMYMGHLLDGGNPDVEIFKSEGKTEPQVTIGNFDLCAVLRSSGTTLRETRLRVIDIVMTTRPGFFVSEASWGDPNKRRVIDWFAKRFRRVNQAVRKSQTGLNRQSRYWHQSSSSVVSPLLGPERCVSTQGGV